MGPVGRILSNSGGHGDCGLSVFGPLPPTFGTHCRFFSPDSVGSLSYSPKPSIAVFKERRKDGRGGNG